MGVRRRLVLPNLHVAHCLCRLLMSKRRFLRDIRFSRSVVYNVRDGEMPVWAMMVVGQGRVATYDYKEDAGHAH